MAMKKTRLFISAVVLTFVITALGFTQDRVLLGQYVNPSTFSGAKYGGNNSIYFDATQNYLAACSVLDYSTIFSMVSVDGGASFQTSEVINTGASPQVRNPSVTGYAGSPVFVFDRRDAATSAEPWTRYKVFYGTDDFGWGGGAYSTTQVGLAGTQDDVLDSYIPNIEVSSLDPNLWAVLSHHGSSQPGGEYQQVFVSVDGGQNWSDRIKVASSSAADSLQPYHIGDLTTNPADIQFGPDGTLMAVGTGKFDFDFLATEHLWYTVSTDSGQTWSALEVIPGSEGIVVSWSVVDRGWNIILDAENNFHVFALAFDINLVWGAYDFKWDGASWTVNRFVEPMMVDNGLVAIEGSFGDTAPLNAPTLNSDGTLLYSYLDVVDTTGGVNTYQVFTKYSTDNGGSWSAPAQLLDDPEFKADEFVDVARDADGDLHVVYCVDDTVGGLTINYYYQKVDIASLMTPMESPIVVNEFMFDVTNDDDTTPTVNEGDINGDGERSVRGDEFIEIYNSGDQAVDISGYEFLKRDLTVFFTFPANTVLDPGEFAVVFGGVSANGFGAQFPADLQLFAAVEGDGNAGFAGADGTTNLSNSNDNIILVNPAAQDTIAEYYWGSAVARTSVGVQLEAPNTVGGQSITGSIHQSVTRNPDFTGLWDLHTTASANGYFQSPGSTIDAPFVTGIDDESGNRLPMEYALYQNYPNPFNPTTTIQFDLKKSTRVFLGVYSITGQRVATLISNQAVSAGSHSVVWDAQNFASGIYYYKLYTQDGFNATQKMILIK
jgi:hypothetical protein